MLIIHERIAGTKKDPVSENGIFKKEKGRISYWVTRSIDNVMSS